MKKFFTTVLCAMLLYGNISSAGSALFTSEQLSNLKAAGRDVIAPAYLPDGYRVEKIIVDRKYPETPSYAILFAGPSDTCFVVEMGTEVGDMIVESEKGGLVEPKSEIHNPILGDTAFWNSKEYLGTDWFPSHNGAAYCVKGDIDRSVFSKDKSVLRVCKTRMHGDEFIKVTKSLSIFK